VRGARWIGLAGALALAAGMWGCAERVAPGAQEYRPMPFLSRVTVTGGDVPGPLRIRDVSLRFGDGTDTLKVPMNGRVEAMFRAWINGHGQFVGHWEADGAPVDKVSVFITYGEVLEVRLGGPEVFPATQAGRHTVRFVVESPAPPPPPLELTYEVEPAFR
jgi:hypothetical protein